MARNINVSNKNENQSQELMQIAQILRENGIGSNSALDKSAKAMLKRLSYSDDIDLARKAGHLRRLYPQAAGVSTDEITLLEILYDNSIDNIIKGSALRLLCMYLPDAFKQSMRVLDGLKFREEDVGEYLAIISCSCAAEIVSQNNNLVLLNTLIQMLDGPERLGGSKASARDAIIIGLKAATSGDVFRMSMVEDRDDELWVMARNAIAAL
jgi:hypothetical protein